MTTTEKNDKPLKKAIAFFVPKALQRQTEVADLSLPTDISSLPNTRDFIVNYPPLGCGQEDHDAVVFVMNHFSERIISRIAYDSSARTLHKCHPRRRLLLHEKIVNWFYDRARRQAVLWLTAPVSVRTSVIIQVFAESLALSGNLGAALFLSKVGHRNDIQRVLVTVAFQLAVRIPSYAAFVAEQITRDPGGSLEGGVKEQFEMLIAEPFGRRKIGKGGGPWGILLDGLDECEGRDLQHEIICLIGDFISNYPHAPLVWVITSRPQPYLGSAFKSEAMLRNHWSEYIQGGRDHNYDSDEEDSDDEEEMNEERREQRREQRREWRERDECILITQFNTTRTQFSHLPSKWPSEIQMLKLTQLLARRWFSSETLVRFIVDTDYADPISNLNQILSVIEPWNDGIISHSCTAQVDALYAHILSSVPSDSWEATKQAVEFILYDDWQRLHSSSVKAMSTVLGLKKGTVVQTLRPLRPMLYTFRPPRLARIFAGSPSNTFHSHTLWTRHIQHSQVSFWQSFEKYLLDPARSQDNFVGTRYRNNVALTYCRIYLDAPWNSEWGPIASRIKRMIPFYHDLRVFAINCVYHLITGRYGKYSGRNPLLHEEARSECLDILSQVNIIELYMDGYWADNLTQWLFKLWHEFGDELRSRELVKEVQLRDLTFDRLDCKENKVVRVQNQVPESPLLPWTLQGFVDELRASQQISPSARVLICGSVPERRNALFLLLDRTSIHSDIQYYCIPYPY